MVGSPTSEETYQRERKEYGFGIPCRYAKAIGKYEITAGMSVPNNPGIRGIAWYAAISITQQYQAVVSGAHAYDGTYTRAVLEYIVTTRPRAPSGGNHDDRGTNLKAWSRSNHAHHHYCGAAAAAAGGGAGARRP